MTYDIYRQGTIIQSLKLEGSLTTAVMGKDVIDCSFRMNKYFEFQIGDYLTAFNKTYYLNLPAEPIKNSNNDYTYSLQFEAEFYNLSKVAFLGLDASNNYTQSTFSITGNASMIIDVILTNLGRAYTGWAKGDIDDTEAKSFDFDNQNCLQVLVTLADTYNLEYWFDGKTIFFGTRVIPSILEFAYGRGNGLYNIQRQNNDNKNIFTRVYFTGSDRNLDNTYRNGGGLLLLPSAYGYYLENTTAISAYGLIEGFKNFPDIYPKYVGTVTEIDSSDSGYNKFTDANIDFNINDYLLQGQNATLSFLTGQLAGWEFEIGSYAGATKSFVFNQNTDEKALTVPSTVLRPAVGDTYTIYNITMPESYITNAENELLTEAQKYMDEVSNPVNKYKYTVQCDPLYLRRNGIEPAPQYQVKIIDSAMAINDNIRISQITRDLQNIWLYTLEITNNITVSDLAKEVNEENKIIYTVKQLDDTTSRKAMSFRNYFKNFRAFMARVFDTDGYFDGSHIKPNTVETLALAVGAKSQNFKLNNVVFDINADHDPAKINVSLGQLIHLELSIDGLGFTWQMSSGEFQNLDPALAYWVYARCSKSALVGNWVVTTEQIKVEDETGYYNFLTGLLYPVNADTGYRDFDLTNGVTTIVGGRVTTGRIQDATKENFFDLDNGSFNLGDSANGLDFNITKPNTLTIRNAVMAANAIIENLVVQVLATQARNASGIYEVPYLKASDAELDVWNANTSDETDKTKALVRMGIAVASMIQLANGSYQNVPGISVSDVNLILDGVRAYYSELSAGGIFSNGSSVNGIPATAGIKSNFSIVGLLQKRNDDANGISAGIFGIDQTTEGNSQSYGGYFNSLFVNRHYFPVKQISANYTITTSDYFIACYNSSQITVTLPTPPTASGVGLAYKIKLVNNQSVILNAGSNQLLMPNGNAATSADLNFFVNIESSDTNLGGSGASAEVIWDGQYWLVSQTYGAQYGQ